MEADRGIRYGSDHGDRLCCRIFRRVYDHDGDGKRDGAFLERGTLRSGLQSGVPKESSGSGRSRGALESGIQ